MSRNVIGASFLSALVGIIVGLGFRDSPSVLADQQPSGIATGRFAYCMHPLAVKNQFLLDTATGQTWQLTVKDQGLGTEQFIWSEMQREDAAAANRDLVDRIRAARGIPASQPSK